MIVAMTTSKSHDKKLLEEGQELAKEWEAIFISNEGQDLPGEHHVTPYDMHVTWTRYVCDCLHVL